MTQDILFRFQPGDIVRLALYGRVTQSQEKDGRPTVTFTPITIDTLDSKQPRNAKLGEPFMIEGQTFLGTLVHASTAYTSQTLSRQAVIEKLISARDIPFTVKFVKANGEARTIVGCLAYQTDRAKQANLLGRSIVREFIVDETGKIQTQHRQVDHRTIYSLTIRGIQYIVKRNISC